MPALNMRQLRQMLRLAGSGTSSHEIAVILSTVQDNLKRAAMVGLSWPLPGELTEDALGFHPRQVRVRQMPLCAGLDGQPCRVQDLLLFRPARAYSPAGRFPTDRTRAHADLAPPIAEWTPERFRRWSASIGPQTEGLVAAILASRPHPKHLQDDCLTHRNPERPQTFHRTHRHHGKRPSAWPTLEYPTATAFAKAPLRLEKTGAALDTRPVARYAALLQVLSTAIYLTFQIMDQRARH